jgi:hypothetical protein
MAISFFFLKGSFHIQLFKSASVLFFLLIAPLSFLAISISLLGIYQQKKWGCRYTLFFLFLYVAGFAFLCINQLFPGFYDDSVQIEPGYFIIFHMKLNMESFIEPICAFIYIVLLNLKPVRAYIDKGF